VAVVVLLAVAVTVIVAVVVAVAVAVVVIAVGGVLRFPQYGRSFDMLLVDFHGIEYSLVQNLTQGNPKGQDLLPAMDLNRYDRMLE